MPPAMTVAGLARAELVPAGQFALVMGWTLRNALRRRDYISLIAIAAWRECAGYSVPLGPDQLAEFADSFAPMLRDTDLFGELDERSVGILLCDADADAIAVVIRRIAEGASAVCASAPLTVAIGAATCPTNAIDVQTLAAFAASHFLVRFSVPCVEETV